MIRRSSIVNLSSGFRRKAAQRDNRERVVRRLSPLVTTLKLFEGSLRCAIHCAPCRIRSRQKTVAEVECKPIEIQPAAWRFVENLPSSALPSLSRTLIYVGPLVREGFVDIDTGIRDSIRDIRQEVRGRRLQRRQRTGR